MVTQKEIIEALRNHFSYCPESGKFSLRHDSPNKRWKKGHVTEFDCGCGYLAIRILGKRIKCHRAAWMYFYGSEPDRNIDHINGDRKDNRIVNLRLATNGENSRNSAVRMTNTCGYKGVTKRKDCAKWQAAITVNGRRIHLGNHHTPELAYAAYCKASEQYHGNFGRVA